jgi:glycosyltransferase involved in cell wall biosynthesis
VVPCGDAAALAHAVGELAGAPARARQMGARGAALARAEHSWRARAIEIDKVLRACLARTAK